MIGDFIVKHIWKISTVSLFALLVANLIAIERITRSAARPVFFVEGYEVDRVSSPETGEIMMDTISIDPCRPFFSYKDAEEFKEELEVNFQDRKDFFERDSGDYYYRPLKIYVEIIEYR